MKGMVRRFAPPNPHSKSETEIMNMPELDFSILATLRKPTTRGRKVQNLIGRKFGRITPLGFLGLGSHGAKWLCRCDCGAFSIVTASKLLLGSTISCSCYRRNRLGNENRTHGQSHSKLHSLWGGIHSRCYNPKVKRYSDYGGRGIRVVERWHSFENFRDDVGVRPEGMTIERIDNNGDYGPDNFRWATRQEQSYNKRNNRLVTHNGETKCLAEWIVLSGLSRHIVTDGLNQGLTLAEIFKERGVSLAHTPVTV
jgi:hypothetical protein